MRIAAKMLKCFGYAWLILLIIVMKICLIMIWINEGFAEVQRLMSPFNVVNYIATIVMASPGLTAFWLAGKIEKRQLSQQHHSDSEYDEPQQRA